VQDKLFNSSHFISSLKEFPVSRTGKNVGVVYLGKVIEAVFALISSILIARMLGPENLGVLILVMTYANILSVVMGFGLDTTVVKFLADSRNNNTRREPTILKCVFLLRLLFIIVSAIIAYIINDLLAVQIFHSSRLSYFMKLGILIAIVNSIFILFQACLRGYENFNKMVISNTYGRMLRLIFIIAIYIYGILDINKVLWANILSAVIIILMDSIFLWPILNKTKLEIKSGLKNEFSEIFCYSGWMFGTAILYSILENMNVIMLGNMEVSTAIGLYSVAVNMLKPFEYFPDTLNQVILPKISGIKTKTQLNLMAKKIIFAGGGVSLLLLPIIIFPGPIISLFFGARYVGSSWILSILSLSMAVKITLNPMILLGHRLNIPRWFTISSFVAVLLNFILNLIFVPKYGGIGCAISSLLVILISRSIIITKILKAPFPDQDKGYISALQNE
jgi:O-antigen/teichoic acid export membrane protein